MSDIVCPACQSAIPLEEVNVSTDIALCRACGQTSSFAELAAWSDVEHGPPPKHLRIEERADGSIQMTYKRIPFVAFFILPVLLLWGYSFLWKPFVQPWLEGSSVVQSQSGTPPVIHLIIIFSALTGWLFFGSWRIILRDGLGKVLVGIGPLCYTRSFHYDRTSQVRLVPSNIRVNRVRQDAICVSTGGVDFKFGAIIHWKCRNHIAAVIRRAARQR
jgi:hypothetical protein